MTNSKKFFDIIPPPKSQKTPFREPDFKEKLKDRSEKQEKKKTVEREIPVPSPGKSIKNLPRSARQNLERFAYSTLIPKKAFWQFPQKLTLLAMGILIVGGIFCQFVLAKTKIIIWPKTETPSLSELVTIDSNASQVSIEGKVIPGKIFEAEKTASQQFSTTGKSIKEEKAVGQIRVYNNSSTSPQSLVANTRFLSDDGKLFKTVERLIVPGAKSEKSNVLGQKKLTPGFIDIKVVAAEAGPDYNIGPSTFSIPGFAGTPKYTAFYGKSFSSMEGGFRGEIFKLSKQDLENAKNTLIERLKKEGKDALNSTIPEGFILLDGGTAFEVLETSSPAKEGAEVETFNFRAKMKINGMGVENNLLESFAKKFILMNVGEDKKITEGSLKITHSLQSLDFSTGKTVLNLNFGAKVFKDIDTQSLKSAILGKSTKEAKVLLEQEIEADKVLIQTFPFWIKTVPEKAGKVKIELRVD